MADKLTVLVTGATGKQGGALARRLLQRGHVVRCLTRNPDKPEAKALQQLGGAIAVGNFDRPPTVEAAAKGCDAMYLLSTPFEQGVEAETLEGRAGVDAARRAGVRHLLYSSVASADRATGIPHFESKYRVEQYIHSLDLPHTIVGPVFFAENYLAPWLLPDLQKGVLSMPMPGDRALQQIPLADIAAFDCYVLENRARFLGERIDIASFEATPNQVADTLSRLSGRKIAFEQTPHSEAQAQNADMARMYEWFTKVGTDVDLPGLRREYPDVAWQDLDTWARSVDWKAVLAGAGTGAQART